MKMIVSAIFETPLLISMHGYIWEQKSHISTLRGQRFHPLGNYKNNFARL